MPKAAAAKKSATFTKESIAAYLYLPHDAAGLDPRRLALHSRSIIVLTPRHHTQQGNISTVSVPCGAATKSPSKADGAYNSDMANSYSLLESHHSRQINQNKGAGGVIKFNLPSYSMKYAAHLLLSNIGPPCNNEKNIYTVQISLLPS